MIQVKELLAEGLISLCAAGVENASRDTALIMGNIIGNSLLSLDNRYQLNQEKINQFRLAIQDRSNRKPIAQILGYREFYGRLFYVNQHVLDPRPESESLIDLALEIPYKRVLELGVGSGCLLLTLLIERADAEGVGIDICNNALETAKLNRDSLKLGNRCKLFQSDWFANPELEKYDLIISNPPYTSADEYARLPPEIRIYEPRQALTLGGKGTEAYEIIARSASNYLNPNGYLVLEIGYRQFKSVRKILESFHCKVYKIGRDLDGRIRVVMARYSV